MTQSTRADSALSSPASATETILTVAKAQGDRNPSTEAPMLVSLVPGILLTALVYLVLWPLRHTAVGSMFYIFDDPSIAWVPPVEVLLACWSVSMLAMKWRRHRVQALALSVRVLPSQPSDISADNIDTVIGFTRKLPEQFARSFLVRRVQRALYHFKARKNRSEVASLLAAQSEIDSGLVSSSYTLLRVFIWALPILGFIGTVLGISGAVGGFSGLSEIERLKPALEVVTTSLAGAFETTLIALVLALLVMIPTSILQKAEQDLLSRVDEYCNDTLMRRLSEPATELDASNFAITVTKRLVHDAPIIGEKLAEQFARSAAAALSSGLSDALRSVMNEVGAMVEQTRKCSERTDELARQSGTLATALTDAADVIRGAADTCARLPKDFETRFRSLLQDASLTAKAIDESLTGTTAGMAQAAHAAHDAANGLREAAGALPDRIEEAARGMATSIDNAEDRLAESARLLGHAIEAQRAAQSDAALQEKIRMGLSLITAAMHGHDVTTEDGQVHSSPIPAEDSTYGQG